MGDSKFYRKKSSLPGGWSAESDAFLVGPCPHSWLFPRVSAVSLSSYSSTFDFKKLISDGNMHRLFIMVEPERHQQDYARGSRHSFVHFLVTSIYGESGSIRYC